MIRKFFGEGDVFIYTNSATTLQEKQYNKGDMIAYFSRVQLALGYDLKHKESVAATRQLSYTEQEPYSLTVAQVPNTKEVDKLFFKEMVKTEVPYSTITTYKNVEEVIFLKDKTSPLKIKMFSNGEEVVQEGSVSYSKEDNMINLDKKYDSLDVISYHEESGEKRSFDRPNLGYLSVKGVIKGKVGDKEGTFVLDVPLVDLVSEPVMDLTEDSNYNLTLSFALINPEKNKPSVVFVNG